MKTQLKRILGIAMAVCMLATVVTIPVSVSAANAEIVYSADFDNLANSELYVSGTSGVSSWLIADGWTASLERGYLAPAGEAAYGGAGIKDGAVYVYRNQRAEAGGNFVGAQLALTGGTGKVADFDMAVNSNIGTGEGQTSSANQTIKNAKLSGIEVSLVNGSTVVPVFGVNTDNNIYLFHGGVVDYATEANKTEVTIADSLTDFHRFRVALTSGGCKVYADGALVGTVAVSGMSAFSGLRFSAEVGTMEKTRDAYKNQALIDNLTVLNTTATITDSFAGVADTDLVVDADDTLDSWGFFPLCENWTRRLEDSGVQSDSSYAGVRVVGEKLHMYRYQANANPNLFVGARRALNGTYPAFTASFDFGLNSNFGTFEGYQAVNGPAQFTQYAGVVFYLERPDHGQQWPIFGVNTDDYVYMLTEKPATCTAPYIFDESNKTAATVADSTTTNTTFTVDVSIDSVEKTINYSLYMNGQLIGTNVYFTNLAEDEIFYQPSTLSFDVTNITTVKSRVFPGVRHDAYVDNLEIEIPSSDDKTVAIYNRGTKADNYFEIGFSEPHGLTSDSNAEVVCNETEMDSTNVSITSLDAYTIRVNHTPANAVIGGNYTVTIPGARLVCERNGLSSTLGFADGKATLTYKNTGAEISNAVLVCAVYDNATGKLVDVKADNGTLAAGAGAKGADMGVLETAAVAVGEGQTAKTFLWNGLTLKPIK